MLLAHQGGWDEILMVLVPLLLFAVLLYIANRRANALAAERETGAGADRPDDDGDDLPADERTATGADVQADRPVTDGGGRTGPPPTAT